MKQKYIDFYMNVARDAAKLSHARRLKVGAVIVKDDSILSYGYNGTPAGFDNNCENIIEDTLVTKPEVIHAEMNAIAKVARQNSGSRYAEMFITHAPCVECAKMICQAGIKTVYYCETYRSDAGLNLLHNAKVDIFKV